MRKAFMGVRLRRLREEQKLKQVDLAHALDISPSYLNQLEQNQRPLTVPVLLKLNAVFGVDVQFFSEDEEGRLLTELRDALSDSQEEIATAEVRELVMNMPAVGRALVSLHKKYRESIEQNEAMASQLGDDWVVGSHTRMPFEQVRDFFYARHNYVDVLDEVAERLYEKAQLSPRALRTGLIGWMREHHGVQTIFDEADGFQRRYDPTDKILYISPDLSAGQQAFQIATQLAFLEVGPMIDQLASSPNLSGAEAQKLARVGLANYFAGALVLPYRKFLKSAEAFAYDIDRLSHHYGVGFETICHRLSTLQRAEARGVPFFFVRVDRAGNISKRQSATDFHFSRVGGSCPLWNVYEAFAQPGKLITQITQMPDGRSYLWVARTVGTPDQAYGKPGKSFAIGLGCDIRHAERLVYARGLDLTDPASATPIGAGCKVCARPNCAQRAFPMIGRSVFVDPNRSLSAPYPVDQ